MKKNCQFFLLLLLVFESCSPSKNLVNPHFQILNSFYQSWIVNENEKGTDVVIELKDVHKELVFDSIVFWGNKVQVTVKEENSIVRIQGIITKSTVGLKTRVINVEEPDQLLYIYQGKRYSYPLKDIKRKKMRYF